MKVPRLPATLVAVLAVLGTVLVAVGPILPDAWRPVAVGVVALLGILGVPITHKTVRQHGQDAADAGAKNASLTFDERASSRRRPPSSGGTHRTYAPAVVLLALLPLGVLDARLPAPIDRMRRPVAASVAVPVIQSGVMSCDEPGTVVLQLAQETVTPAGKVLHTTLTASGVTLEGWFASAWHPTAYIDDGQGRVRLRSPYGYWRAVLPAPWGSTIGEAYLVQGRACDSDVLRTTS